MAIILAWTGLTLAATSFAFAVQDESIEQSIRDSLSEQGDVQQVEMILQDKDHYSGFALLLDVQGRPWRLDCTAARPVDGDFEWRCNPVVNEAAIEDVENAMRELLGQQATVLEVAMNRLDDDRMTGFARLRDRDGAIVRTNCTATRESEGSRTFDWECQPE